MPHGLPRKIRIAFLLQAAMVSVAIVLGVYVVSVLFKYSLVNTALQEEADHFWQLYSASPAQPPPNTYNLRGYLVLTGHSNLVLPENLRELKPGFHELKDDDLLVWVDQRPPGRLYLVLLRSQAARIAFWFGTVPIGLALLTVYLVTWLTYRSSRRLVSPVTWLARQVSHWDPRRPVANDLAPDQLPADVQGETRQLALALHALALRVTAHVARERDFTRDASHELRTPLTVIRVASDMAQGEPELSPRLQRALQRIQRAGRDMEAVIDAFLILARESDVEPQSELFSMCDVVEYEAENARTLLLGKPVQLTVTCEARPRLLAPPRVMHVVVSNLLRNACSYTDQGEVQVLLQEDRFTVIDTGIGMSEESLRRAYEPFYRANPAHPRGTGLGLSIVKRLCDRFGWEAVLESVPGQGTRASVRFGD